MSLGKVAIWVGIVIIGVVIFLVAFNAVKKHAQPLVMSPEKFQELETGELTDETDVIITWEDSRLHRIGCPYIKGAKEKVKYRAAKEQRLNLCPYCMGEEE
ncbi:MAG: hypothetical protein ACK4OO_05970 [bacterium]